MLDKIMDRLMETAANAYMPRIKKVAELRRKELVEMKSKIRSEPNAVEAWFDIEIDKVVKLDPKNLFSDHVRCDGRDLNPGYQIGNLMS
jgi:hypothetical protein